ncbi:MAG: protein translocase subunit SecF [Deltaproteobacteria bacterium]
MEFLKKETHFDFMGKRNLFIGISLAFIVFSALVFVTRGLKFGIDFAGGTEIQVKFLKPLDSLQIRKLLTEAGYLDSSVQHFGKEESGEYLVRLEESGSGFQSVAQKLLPLFTRVVGEGNAQIEKVEIVGPRVGGDLKKRGAWALFYSLLGILIYVAIRFDYRFSPGGVVALIHDVIISLGVFAFFGKRFDLTILAAVLTIIGYSINDTIVIFDRIRENIKKHQGLDIAAIVNRSVNETLSRTILTGLTTFFMLLALFFFGGEVIHDFAFIMLVGMVVGTYSSIFIASPVFLYLHRRTEKKLS